MTNNKLTDEFLEKLIATGTYALDEGFIRISDDSELMAMARELQEYRKAAPVEINDEMAFAFCRAISDDAVGADEVEDIKAGLRAAFANITTPQPAPAVEAVPLVMKDHQIRELVNELRDIAVDYHGTQQLRERIARTLRAAMQPQPVSNRDELPGWVMVPVEPTAEMISSGIAAHYERNQIQIHDRPAPGPMECAYVAMLAAAPQQEAKS